ncbi:MAG: tRNA (guanine-N1)-methyltransferase [Flavobacteriaceae bacterium]|nr:tRNA (guanine-N1)-methyltransferase [Flavobacteriaceae bacterium]
MNRLYFFLLALILSVSTISAQETEKELSLTNSTVPEKFDYIITKSNNFQEFKVVKRTWLHTIKKQVLDSVNKQKKAIKALAVIIEDQKSNTTKLESKIEALNNEITIVNTGKDNISFVGSDMKKDAFKNLFWSIISVLSILLLFFIYKFKNSNTITQEAKAQLADIEKEYENHKKTALEREQKVMRKLQDELNRNRH